MFIFYTERGTKNFVAVVFRTIQLRDWKVVSSHSAILQNGWIESFEQVLEESDRIVMRSSGFVNAWPR